METDPSQELRQVNGVHDNKDELQQKLLQAVSPFEEALELDSSRPSSSLPLTDEGTSPVPARPSAQGPEGEGVRYPSPGYQPPEASYRPNMKRVVPPKIVPIMPQRPEASRGLRLVFLALFLGLIFGGYYGYCRYQVNDAIYRMTQESTDLYQDLLHVGHALTPDDIKAVALAMARDARVQANPQEIMVSIEPLNDENSQKLSALSQMGMQIMGQMPQGAGDVAVVGFKGRFFTSSGILKKYFIVEYYTWSQDVAAPYRPVSKEKRDPRQERINRDALDRLRDLQR
jgi:hypothetical protein